MKTFGPIPEGSHCVGQKCFLCENKIEIGDIVCLLPLKPAGKEEAKKMKEGNFYTAKCKLVHSKCNEKLSIGLTMRKIYKKTK